MFLPSLPADEWLAVAAELPIAPAIFSRLGTLLSKPCTTLEDVVATVQLDPILTARIVRVANSPLYLRGEPVVAITEAIAYIGTQETSKIVGVMVASQLCAQGLPHYKIDSDALWNCCVSSAVAARLLAARVGLPEGECYTISLLRGIGWLVLERFAKKNALPVTPQALNDPASVAKWERHVFGMNAAEAAVRVLSLWSFSQPAVAALRRLGKRPYTDPTTALLALANAISDRLGLGLKVERGSWIITPHLLTVVGLDPECIEEIVHETQGEIAKLRKIVVHSTLPAAG